MMLLNVLVVAIPSIMMLVVVALASLPPRIKPLSPDELKDTAEYHNRLNRNGVFTHPRLAAVISIGTAQEKRVLSLKARQWA
jgi:hypothetical protein